MDIKEKITMAYLAGAIDGDGSLALCKSMRRDQINHYPLIQLGNLKEDLIDFFISVFGGNKAVRIPKEGSKRRKFFCWRVTNSPKCLPVLENLYEFLVGKKDRCSLLINFIKENPSQSGGKKLSPDLICSREKSYFKMQELNAFNPMTLRKSNNKPLVDTQDPIFWSYVAGLFDTDGHFSISSRLERYFRPHIHLHMNDLRCINHISENFAGGRLGVKKDKSCKYGFIYRWEISKHDEIKRFIKNISPYLRQKKNQALIMLKFLEEKKQYTNSKPFMPESEIKFRSQCKEEISRLNNCDLDKPSLIDLEAYSESHGDKAEDISHRERLSERAL